MKFYLSSFGIGDKGIALYEMLPSDNKTIGHIPNALDFSHANLVSVQEVIERNCAELEENNLTPVNIDLKDFFGKKEALREKIRILGGLWVSGGNVFVLRQAMRVSGLDDILHAINDRHDFVYGGYSAGGCVLSPSLHGYQIVDDATDTPYAECEKVIWDGIGLIDFAFLPHFQSDHPESSDIDKEVQYCIEHNISYKTLRDGEVIIIE